MDQVWVRLATVLLLAFSLTAEDRPSVVHLTAIDYPRLAHWAGIQGTVKLALIINLQGTVSAVKYISGNGLLGEPAGEVLKKRTFSRCDAEECVYPMTIQFVLNGGPFSLWECKTEFDFDNPGAAIVSSQFAKAIVD